MTKVKESGKLPTVMPDDQVADAIVNRRLRWLMLIGLTFEFGLIFYTRSMQIMYRFNFFTEGTFFTWFSGAQLAAISLISLANAYLSFVAGRLINMRAWLCAGLFALVLTLSELLAIHERIAPFSGSLFAAIGLASLKSSFWDIPVFLVYGVTAILIWRYLRADLNRSHAVKFLLSTGFILMSISLALDIFGSRILLVLWEDSFKLIGFFFFLAAFTGSLLLKLQRRGLN